MELDKFILSKPDFDFFLYPKGEYNLLRCGKILNGEFESFRTFQFDTSRRIRKEIGYQTGWTAYPPGTNPPPPTKYLRNYRYEDDHLKLISENEYDSNKPLKTYEITYLNSQIIEIVEKDENRNDFSPKRTTYEYDSMGNLMKEIINVPSIGDGRTYMTSEIIRNPQNQIIKIINSNSVAHKGKLISKQNTSIDEIEYKDKTIKKIHKSTGSISTFATTAIILSENSELVLEILYPEGFYKLKEVFQYDTIDQNVIRKSTYYKENVDTEIYKYE